MFWHIHQKLDKLDKLTASTSWRIEMIYNMLMHFYNILSNLNNNSGLVTRLKHSENRPMLMSSNKIFYIAKVT